MLKVDVDQFAGRRPFEPFEIRLVDGQRFRFTTLEQFVVGRTAMATVTKSGDIFLISIALISTIRPAGADGKRPSRKGERR